MAVGDGTSVKEFIDFVNLSGLGTIGTPEDACDQIDRLIKQSNGGFGAYLQLAHDWADSEAKFRSYELFARHVAPRFQGQQHSTLDAKRRAAAARPGLAADNMKGVESATAKYQAELDAKKKPTAKAKTKK
jgi:limonene 1,2-monooxygenase